MRPVEIGVAVAAVVAGIVFLAGAVADPPSAPPLPNPGAPVERGGR